MESRCKKFRGFSHRAFYIWLALILGTQLMYGCASSRTYKETTVRDNDRPSQTTTTTVHDNDGIDSSTTTTTTQDDDSDNETTVVKEETTRASDGGIFGGFFHFVGEVLAFPFRVVAGVFDAIF